MLLYNIRKEKILKEKSYRTENKKLQGSALHLS
jgi:hypothetical protein